MIRLFAANETVFTHYETVLTDVLSFETEEEENGIWFCEMTCPLDARIEEGKIIKAPTPRGEQLFRIIKVKKSLPAMTLYVYGRHISYDLLNNMVLDVRPTDTTQNNALAAILGGTEYAHGFTASSDVPGIATAYYIRVNPIQAIMGSQDNSALNLWGGFLRRNNFALQVLATSPDKGYEIRFGKNLLGADEELDMTDVVTRLYPTVVIEEPVVTALPEKYVDSPLINNYPNPIIKEYRIPLTDEEKLLPIADIYQLMRDRCAEQYTLKADLPKSNYKIDFVELRKTEQYKDFAVLEDLDISDTVWVYANPLNLNMSARMIKYRHDGLHDRYLSTELGNFKPKLTNQKAEFVKLVTDATKNLTDGVITAMLKDAIDRIQGNLGGNVVTITNNGKPVAHAYMDTDDVATANDYVIINSAGIAFGTGGLTNPPNVAIDINGNVVSTSGFFSSLVTNLIASDIGSDLVLSSNNTIRLVANTTVEINELGLTIDDGVSPTISRHDGGATTYLDRNTGNPFASYAAGSADVDILNARKVYSPHVANKVSDAVSVYVDTAPSGDGSGRDASNKASSLDRALQTALDGAMVIEEDVTVYVSGKVTEALRLKGFSGGGRIIVQGRGQITGQISVINCSCRVDFNLLDVVRPDISATAALISVVNSCDVRVNGCRLDGYSVGTGIGAYYGGGVYVTDCDIVKCEYAYDASVNARIAQVGCRGANNLYVGNSALGSNIVLSDTRPIATNIKRETAGGVITDASSTGQTSTFAATPATWQTVSKTFTGRLSTANRATGYVWKTGTWTQGTWDGTAQRGYADFGTAIKTWLESAGGYQNISSVIIKARRNSSSGASSAVSLKIGSPSAQTLPAVGYGATSQATLIAALVTAMTSGALKLQSTTTSTADYAAYDLVEIIVTAEKKA